MKRLFFVGIIFSLIATSCTKDDEKPKTDLLCDEDWQLSEWVMKFEQSGVSQTVDIMEAYSDMGIDECVLDDLIDFDEDGTFTNKPGAIACSENYGLVGNGEWEFKSDESILSMTVYGDSEAEDYTIKIINEETLSLSIIETVTTQSPFLKSAKLSPLEDVDVEMIMTFKH